MSSISLILVKQEPQSVFDNLPLPSTQSGLGCVSGKQKKKTIKKNGFIKSHEENDKLEERPYVFLIAEDSTFKTPFLC